MENIVRLSEYRNRRKRPAAAPRAPLPPASHGPQYYCTRCDAEEFRLEASGRVHCARCGALMRNLLVSS